MAQEHPTTDAGTTSPRATGGSMAVRPLNPKELADGIEAGKIWLPWTDFPGEEASALIIAALRAYEPPCQHEWDKRDDGREWWWSGEFKIWLHRCLRCGVAEVARDLVPGEAAP